MKPTYRFLVILCGFILVSASARAQSSLWTNLVSYWPFDTETAGSTPDLAVGNNLILSNSPSLVTGERGNAFQFNGTSQFLGLVHSTSPLDTGLPIYYSSTGYTIAFWVNGTPSQADNKTVFSEGNLANSGLLLNLATEGAKLRLYIRNDAGQAVINNYISKATAFDSTWHFVAWTDTNGTGTLYIDGAVDFQTNYPYSLAGGMHANDDSVAALYRATPVNFFTGMVDELALWNRVLSPTEIQSFMTNSIPTPIPAIGPLVTAQPAGSTNDLGDRVTFSAHIFGTQPMSYQWLSNSVPLVGQTNNTLTLTDLTMPGTNYYALVGSNIGGSITSTPAILVVLPDPTPDVPEGLVSDWPFDTIAYTPTTNTPDLYSQENMTLNLMDSNNLVPGVFGNALSFDGATQYGSVTGATPIYNLSSTYTVAFWVKGAANQTDKQVFANGDSTANNYFYIGTDNTGASGKVDVSVQPGMSDTLSTGTAFDGTWHHIVWVDEDGTGLLYIDGVLDPTAFNYTRGSVSLNNTTAGALLASTLRDYFAGEIDDLGVWSRRLTYTEIQLIRTNGIPAPTGPVTPTIFSLTTQPPTLTGNVYQGDTVSFTAQAGGTLPLSYQWLENNVPISSVLNPTAVSNTLVLTNVQPAETASYSVAVSNSGGSVTSSVVSLTVTAYTPVTNGVALQLEFNNSSAGPIQSGFSSMTLSTNPATFNGPEVTLSTIGNTSFSSRARSTPVNNPPNLTQADLYDQFVFTTASTAGTGMDIQINRLAPNTAYELTLWSFDEANQELEDWNEVAGTPVVITNGYRFTGSTLPTADYQDTISSIVISSPQGVLDIQGVLDAANTGNSGVFLNALVLVATNSQTPQIAQQPQSAILTQGNAFASTVVAWGQSPLAYQWYETNLVAQTANALPGQTNASLIFDSVQSSNSGDYYVVITNANGSVMSETVALAVYSTPAILQAYTNMVLFAGASPVFSVTAAGVAPLNYQWTSNGVAITGATNASYTQANLQSGATNYSCIITNSLGSVTDLISVTTIPVPTNSYPQAVLAANPIGYWRLNEPGTDGQTGPNDGVIANDYWRGHDGVYTNMSLGWPGYDPTGDPSDTSAQFGEVDENNDSGDSEANSIAGINFGTPAGTSSVFSVEAWVNGYAQTTDSGMVTLGWGNGGEQFDLDCGSDTSPTSHGFRFLVRDAASIAHAVNSTNQSLYGTWYHLVGVVDEISNQDMVFYINGQSVGTASLPSGSGILASTNLMSIGSRMSGLGTSFDDQFDGNMNDVAVFNYALSAGQVANQYVAGVTNAAPFLVPAPETNAAAYATATLGIPATAYGTGPMGYAWTNLTTSAAVASGVTNASPLNAALIYNNVPASWNGDQLELTVTNAYGSASALVTLSIANVNLNPTNIVFAVTNNQLYLSWPADHTGWQLQAQTNRLSTGLTTNWVNVTGSTATNQMIVPITLTNGSVFYRLTGP